VFIDEKPPAFGADQAQREFQLGAAVAAKAVEHVPGETLGMNPDEHRRSVGHVSQPKNDRLIGLLGLGIPESEDAKVSVLGREIGFGDLFDSECGGCSHFHERPERRGRGLLLK
jgi:hypothetical protein